MCSNIESFSQELQKHFTESAFWGWYGHALQHLILKDYGGPSSWHYRVYDAQCMYDRPKIVGTFQITELPGAGCLALVFHGVYLEPDYRGKKIGDALLAVREEAARKFGIKLLIATVRSNNEAEVALLSKHGWLSTLVIPSKNDGVTISLFTKKL